MRALRVGVLADTHGLLRPRVLERLADCEILLHAGDVGEAAVLAALAAIAPVRAVRGNVDGGELAALPFLLEGEIAGLRYGMTHRREDIPPAWAKTARLVIFGHSHRPELQWQGDCLFLNPGSCGSRRFHLPLTVAALTVEGDRLIPEILAVE
jgi:putative phosphoesterase